MCGGKLAWLVKSDEEKEGESRTGWRMKGSFMHISNQGDPIKLEVPQRKLECKKKGVHQTYKGPDEAQQGHLPKEPELTSHSLIC